MFSGNPGDSFVRLLPWLFLDAIFALVQQPVLWLALVAAQVYALTPWGPPELRWLPAFLFLVGFAVSMAWPFLHR